ncbi:hypothetical protein [Protaetiibacter intestinalis]|uniref:DUF4352 domain-containing protein n=1 Tax=Protaetiibacter intestinalis TaxID=2419774 RepID=A0A387BAF4_9MICO|nr:hypothetical protein [Protaetiibacter intestinalis]AYF98881.1 hypothetical protein D7I47_11865 [Protaetiibacter intestinalis]
MVTSHGGWWRSARAGLLALVLLLPAAAVAALSVDFADYWNGRPREITTVAAGETGELGGVRLRVIDTWTATADSPDGELYGVPEGAALVSVTYEVDPTGAGEEFIGCTVKLLQPDSDRRWSDSAMGTDYWPGRGLPDGVPVSCGPFEEPFPVESAFLIPEDAVGDVVAEVVIGSELPRALQLRLD